METEIYPGPERRRFSTPCPNHADMIRNFDLGDKRMERYEEKIDHLIEGQSLNTVAIQRLEGILNNGLRGDVTKVILCIETMQKDFRAACLSYDTRLAEVEKFQWFRDWANDFRNNLVTRLLTLAFIGGTVIGIIYMFERGIRPFIK